MLVFGASGFAWHRCASQALGIARAALEAAVEYSQQREQFGAPISRLQAIQWKLADMATKIDAVRLLIRLAAWLKDLGEAHGIEASMAKLIAAETAVWCANQDVQIHGGRSRGVPGAHASRRAGAAAGAARSGTAEGLGCGR